MSQKIEQFVCIIIDSLISNNPTGIKISNVFKIRLRLTYSPAGWKVNACGGIVGSLLWNSRILWSL